MLRLKHLIVQMKDDKYGFIPQELQKLPKEINHFVKKSDGIFQVWTVWKFILYDGVHYEKQWIK